MIDIKVPDYDKWEIKFDERYKDKTFYYTIDEECAICGSGLYLILDKITNDDLRLYEEDINKLIEIIYTHFDGKCVKTAIGKYVDSIIEYYTKDDEIYADFLWNKNKLGVVKFNNYIQDVFDLPYKAYECKNSNGDRFWKIRKLK